MTNLSNIKRQLFEKKGMLTYEQVSEQNFARAMKAINTKKSGKAYKLAINFGVFEFMLTADYKISMIFESSNEFTKLFGRKVKIQKVGYTAHGLISDAKYQLLESIKLSEEECALELRKLEVAIQKAAIDNQYAPQENSVG